MLSSSLFEIKQIVLIEFLINFFKADISSEESLIISHLLITMSFYKQIKIYIFKLE